MTRRANAFDPSHTFGDAALNVAPDPQHSRSADEQPHRRGDADCQCDRCAPVVTPGSPGYQEALAKAKQPTIIGKRTP